MKIEPASGAFGARVTDLELADSSDAELRELLMAVYEHRFVAVPSTVLDDDAFVRFGYRVGDPVRFDSTAEHPELFHITNVGIDTADSARGAGHWHTDMSFTPHRPSLTILYSIAAPLVGGETRFCDLAAAYEALPATMQADIDDLTVIHRHGVAVTAGPDEHTPVAPEGWDESTTVRHPLIRRHPITGRKTLFAIKGTCQGIEGMNRDDGIKLLNELCAHAFQAQFVTNHRHRPKDLVIWDNPTTLHRATPIQAATGPDDTRIIRRLSLFGRPPVFR